MFYKWFISMRSKKTLARVKRIEGQINAIQNSLVKENISCTEILQQVAAVDGALNGLMRQLIEIYIKEHAMLNVESLDHQKLEEFLMLCKRYL